MRTLLASASILGALLALAGCASIPAGAKPVTGFQKDKYLGKWYEIARFDFAFERNLDNTTAEYSTRSDGTIGVTNRGYNYRTDKWAVAKGKARFRGSDSIGELEVSFFGPFHSGYNIIAIDDEYKYALVAGGSTKYLWILSRTTDMPDAIRDRYLDIARGVGCGVEGLVWVKHTK